jgi:hypothetical protein
LDELCELARSQSEPHNEKMPDASGIDHRARTAPKDRQTDRPDAAIDAEADADVCDAKTPFSMSSEDAFRLSTHNFV